MTVQADRARAFAALHVKGDPLILYNAWDAGSAKAVAAAGAKAIATGSHAVAAAHGLADGERLPMELALANLERIVAAVDVPVSLDFEGAYAAAPEGVAANVARAIAAGAVGINFEDGVVGGEGLHPVERQAARVAAARAAAEEAGVPLFINARTDVFLTNPPERHAELFSEAIDRAAACAEAGASGIFAPALADDDLIGRFCERIELPVNVLQWKGLPGRARLAELGVARLSYGGGSYRAAMKALEEQARAAFAG